MRLFEVFDLRAGEQFLQSLLAPVDRLVDAPPWAKAMALLAALIQYVQTDAFGGTLAVVLITGILDYYFGVRASKYLGIYDPRIAHAGAMGKITGVMLLFVTRLMEHLVYTQGILNTKGAVATAIGMSLILVDIQSIAHHRETFGAQPIPVLAQCLDLLHRVVRAKLPAPPEEPKP